jgi:hypothetical protein
MYNDISTEEPTTSTSSSPCPNLNEGVKLQRGKGLEVPTYATLEA